MKDILYKIRWIAGSIFIVIGFLFVFTGSVVIVGFKEAKELFYDCKPPCL